MAAKTVEASFPSNLERTVVSSLLLLSKSESESSGSPESLGSSGFSTVKSTGGSAAAEACVDEESAPAQLLTVVTFVSESDDLEVKIVRKKRSETVCMSRSKKPKTSKAELTSPPSSSESVSGITSVEASCLSSSSSAQSFCRQTKCDDNRRRSVGTGHLGRKSTAILGVLSYRSASEVEIRHLLGDTPTTSKALRMLLKLQEVKRYGTGGRGDPYIYTIAN
ncbi:SU(VAR)3-9 homolog 9 [Striga asiatica]|uniref:SU(VAR)3-9 homolog 9 n=1 Tax=Striga asiatica TaxID=4170 RepID=A0A5A7Q431_STRAF|nr:SU(VAR)3-9 homolog 9 [Striga asiatica]